jgi:hypothetical protein
MKIDRILFDSKKTIKLLNNFFYDDICHIIIYYISPEKFKKYKIDEFSKYSYIVSILGNYELCMNLPTPRPLIIGGIIGDNYEIYKLGLKNTLDHHYNTMYFYNIIKRIIEKDRDIQFIFEIEKQIKKLKYKVIHIADYFSSSNCKNLKLYLIKYSKKSLFLKYVDEYIIRKNRSTFSQNSSIMSLICANSAQDRYLNATTTIKKPKYNYRKIKNKHIKKMYIKKF